MIIDHCFNILVNGASPYRSVDFDTTQQVYNVLKTGVRVKRLDCLKSALVMVELLRIEQRTAAGNEMARYFDNFVAWSLKNLPTPMTLALVKYAIKERGFTVKREIREAAGWQLLVKDYKPILLVPDDEALASPVFRKMTKYTAAITAAMQKTTVAIDGAAKPKRRKFKDALELKVC
jgi:hypothetical protein